METKKILRIEKDQKEIKLFLVYLYRYGMGDKLRDMEEIVKKWESELENG